MHSHKKNKLGFWTLLSLVMGNMIGVGIFMLPSTLARYGSLSLVGWGITACGALLLALVFARLSYKFPASGGPYAYSRAAFGDFVGFQVAWTYWISMWVGSAATITATVGYISLFFPHLQQDPFVGFLTGSALVWVLTFLNIFSLKGIGFIQILTTIFKILPLIILVFFGLPKVSWENFTVINPEDTPLSSAILGSIILTMWGFIGIESATIPAHQVEKPALTIPKATLWGTALAGIFYIFVSGFIIGLIPNDVLQKSAAPFAIAAEAIFGPWGSGLIGIVAVVASIGSLNGWFLIQAQVPAAAAIDGLFPKKFSKLNKEEVPVFSLLITGILMNIVIGLNYHKNLVEAFRFMIILSTLAILITYLFSVLAENVLHFKQKAPLSKRRMTESFLLTVGASTYSILAIIGAGKEVIFWGGMLFLLSAPLYAIKIFYKKLEQKS